MLNFGISKECNIVDLTNEDENEKTLGISAKMPFTRRPSLLLPTRELEYPKVFPNNNINRFKSPRLIPDPPKLSNYSFAGSKTIRPHVVNKSIAFFPGIKVVVPPKEKYSKCKETAKPIETSSKQNIFPPNRCLAGDCGKMRGCIMVKPTVVGRIHTPSVVSLLQTVPPEKNIRDKFPKTGAFPMSQHFMINRSSGKKPAPRIGVVIEKSKGLHFNKNIFPITNNKNRESWCNH